jgi:glycosyltransferase involved in cell wall biosynthesis
VNSRDAGRLPDRPPTGKADVKKIAFLTPQYFDDRSYIGGGERWPLNMAMGVAESTGGRYHVEILSYGPQPFRKVLHPGVTLRVMQLARPAASALDSTSWEVLDAIASADLVHIMQAFTRSSDIGYLVAKLNRKPICVTDLGGTSSTIGVQFGSLELADRVVCYSDFGATLLKTGTPVVTIKGGVDARKFTPPENPTREFLLYVGRLLPHKGIDRLIRAVPPDLPLIVCGRPYHTDYYHHLHYLGRGKKLQFITDASDELIHNLYGRAWVNVLPSVYKDCYGHAYVAPELMGLTLLEGMACGTPVMCSRVAAMLAAMPEFIRHGETGYVFDTEDELTRYLTRFATEPGLADRMGRAARLAAETEFDLLVCGAKLASVYDELLGCSFRARRAVA